MRADIQRQIAPIQTKSTQEFVRGSSADQDKPSNEDVQRPEKINFKNVLMQSNKEFEKHKKNLSGADLSEFSDYDSFLENLNRQSAMAKGPKNTLDKDDFLNLFITQLQHQDPLKPKDGTQMASELAQFNSLEQMLNVNNTLERMEKASSMDKPIEMVNFIGKTIEVQGQSIQVDSPGEAQTFFLDLSRPVNAVQMEIKDSEGNVVFRELKGDMNSGRHELSWDGKNTNGEKMLRGRYEVIVTSRADENPVDIPITNQLTIDGIDFGDQSNMLITQLGKYGLSDVIKISDADEETEKVEQNQAAISHPAVPGNPAVPGEKIPEALQSLEQKLPMSKTAKPYPPAINSEQSVPARPL